MIKSKRLLIGSLMALSVITSAAIRAEEQTNTPAETPRSSEEKIAESLKKLVFVPHDTGAPEVTDAGGVRAVNLLPKIELLAPERMARTLSPTPTLYWHISKAAEGPVRFTLLADDTTTIDPLLEIEVDGVDREGIFGVSLDDHGLTLGQDQRYVWSVAISSENDSSTSDLVAQTVMEHSADPALARALNDATPDARAIRLAAEGYWYDAIKALSDQIEGRPQSSWQAARAQLLDQVGLLQAAHFDRRGLTK